jgi:hypothetical protein
MMKWSFEEIAKFREFCRSNDLQDLRAAEFRRLVRLAHSEGLLSEILYEDTFPAESGCHDLQATRPQTAPSIRPTLSPPPLSDRAKRIHMTLPAASLVTFVSMCFTAMALLQSLFRIAKGSDNCQPALPRIGDARNRHVTLGMAPLRTEVEGRLALCALRNILLQGGRDRWTVSLRRLWIAKVSTRLRGHRL